MMKGRYTSKGGIRTYQSAESMAVEAAQLKKVVSKAKKSKRTRTQKKGSRKKGSRRSIAKGLKKLVGI